MCLFHREVRSCPVNPQSGLRLSVFCPEAAIDGDVRVLYTLAEVDEW